MKIFERLITILKQGFKVQKQVGKIKWFSKSMNLKTYEASKKNKLTLFFNFNNPIISDDK